VLQEYNILMSSFLKFHSNYKYFQGNTMTKVFFYFSILFFLFFCYSHFAHAEETITIVPGSSDFSIFLLCIVNYFFQNSRKLAESNQCFLLITFRNIYAPTMKDFVYLDLHQKILILPY